MSTVFDPSALVKAWEAHDRWALAVSDHCRRDKRNRIPNNAGAEVTARLADEQEKAAETLGVSVQTLVAIVQAERRTDPGVDVAGAVARALDGLSFVSTTCGACGMEMPDYLVYTEYHAEQRCRARKFVAAPIDPRMVEAIEGLTER